MRVVCASVVKYVKMCTERPALERICAHLLAHACVCVRVVCMFVNPERLLRYLL